jgi:methylated-DNA-[protein]-cysteine S-methyltransferase
MTTSVLVMESPVGPIRLAADEEAITSVKFADLDTAVTDPDDEVAPLLGEARRQLRGYFSGSVRTFDLPLARRGTDFQRRVWSELEKIPYGVTSSYGEIAGRLGLPIGASRAVGTANGANPIAIVVPCHRVIGAKGKLVGYAAGLERKKFLLNLESAAKPLFS